jgi:trans-aconitate methyltransferase
MQTILFCLLFIIISINGHSFAQLSDAPLVLDKLPAVEYNQDKSHILDLGYGFKRSSLLPVLSEYYPKAKLTGLYSNQAVFEEARNVHGNSHKLFHSAQFDIPDNASFDLIVGVHFLHWFSNQKQKEILVSLNKSLKPGGRLALVISPKKDAQRPFKIALNQVMKLPAYEKAMEGFTQRRFFYTPEQYEALFKQEGFEVESMEIVLNNANLTVSKRLKCTLAIFF